MSERDGRRGVWSRSSSSEWAWGGVEGDDRVSEAGLLPWGRSWPCASSLLSTSDTDSDRVTGGPGAVLSTAEGRLDMERTLVEPGWNGMSWPLFRYCS